MSKLEPLKTMDTLALEADELFRSDSINTDFSLKEVDERVNSIINKGMKKVVHLIFGKFDELLKTNPRIRLMIKEEVDLRFKEINGSEAKTSLKANTAAPKSRRKRLDRITDSGSDAKMVSKIPRLSEKTPMELSTSSFRLQSGQKLRDIGKS